MRALHGLPPGSEVTLSYFPLHWDLQERQAQAQQVGGWPGWQQNRDHQSS
jgi:SET and MYND domain-containing protein